MNCQELKRISVGFLEDVIPPDCRDEVRDHLRKCPACAEMMLDMKKMRAALRMVTTAEHCPEKLSASITQTLFTQSDNDMDAITQHAGELVDA